MAGTGPGRESEHARVRGIESNNQKGGRSGSGFDKKRGPAFRGGGDLSGQTTKGGGINRALKSPL